MKNYKISIIVPVYNIENYIEKCINSIINQTYKNIEILLIDDGSTDGSGKICDEYSKSDQRIRVMHKENGGLVSARQCGAQNATGDYVCNVDGDDWIAPNRIENLVIDGIASNADLIYMNGTNRVYGNNIETEVYKIKPGLYTPDQILEGLANTEFCFKRDMVASQCMFAIKRDLYLKYELRINTNVSIGEDQNLIWLCTLNSNSICVTNNCTYYYNQRPDSLSRIAKKDEIKNLAIIYTQLKTEIQKKNEQYLKKLLFLMARMLVTVDYSKMLRQSTDFLYPYGRVRKYSKIVIYGAGDMGTRMIRSINELGGYKVVAWIDKYERQKKECGLTASAIETIYDLDYDYILIAIVDYDIIMKVKADLITKGIDSSRIALMNPELITEDVIEDCLRL